MRNTLVNDSMEIDEDASDNFSGNINPLEEKKKKEDKKSHK